VGLFGKDPPKLLPQPSGPDYTIETVREHLETIGTFRLQVQNADMKVCLTLIAWNGEKYLMQQSTGSTPSGAATVTLCKQLETVARVMAEFQRIEESSRDYPNADVLLAQGLKGVRDFAFKLANSATTQGGSANLTGYTVDTQILSM
jgi:hypothetical protein